MRIDPTGARPAELNAAAAPRTSTTDESAAPTSVPAAVPASGYLPSAELRRLLQLVRDDPEVRPERLRQVAEKLAQGHYATPESASRTAEAILDAPE